MLEAEGGHAGNARPLDERMRPPVSVEVCRNRRQHGVDVIEIRRLAEDDGVPIDQHRLDPQFTKQVDSAGRPLREPSRDHHFGDQVRAIHGSLDHRPAKISVLGQIDKDHQSPGSLPGSRGPVIHSQEHLAPSQGSIHRCRTYRRGRSQAWSLVDQGDQT